MRDFTITQYNARRKVLLKQCVQCKTLCGFLESANRKVAILRIDVDDLPNKSLHVAKIQNELGRKSTFYFRAVPWNWDEGIIQQIAELGHEVGYHYEDVSSVAERQKIKVKRQKDNPENECEKYLAGLAIESFAKNLERLRKIVPVKTICMHGSPLSRWDSRLLWKYYDYHDFGIVGEPYFDVNFDEVFYITDTGRRWDGDQFNLRDKAVGSRRWAEGEEKKGRFHSTFDIIKAAEEGKLPDKIMMTFHPQRWTDKPVPWVKELVWQNVKNVGKLFLVKIR